MLGLTGYLIEGDCETAMVWTLDRHTKLQAGMDFSSMSDCHFRVVVPSKLLVALNSLLWYQCRANGLQRLTDSEKTIVAFVINNPRRLSWKLH